MSFDLCLTINGAPLAADPNPNTTAPTIDRIFTTPLKAGSAANGPVQILGVLGNGTSCNFTVWVYSPELLTWFKIGDTTNVLARQLGVVGNVPCNADVFVQLTAVVGAPTMFGVAVGFGSKSQDAAAEPTSWKQPVRLATTVALPACTLTGNTLTGTVNGTIPAATTDGTAVAATNDILVKNQGGVAAHLQDGPYRVIDEGLAGGGGRPWVLTRTPHCDESGEIWDGMMVAVGEGTTMAGHVFEQVTNAAITINVTALEFKDLGSLLALVTPLASGTVNAFGATVDTKLQSDGSTVGGIWRSNINWRGSALVTGDLRFDTAASAYAADTATGAQSTLFTWDGATLYFGDNSKVLHTNVQGKTDLTLTVGAVGMIACTAGSIALANSLVGFSPTTTVPELCQLTDLAIGGTGGVRPLLSMHGQDSTVAASTGGSYKLRAGHGVAADGVLSLCNGTNTPQLSITATGAVDFAGGVVTHTGNPTVDMGTGRWSSGAAPALVGSRACTDGYSLAWRDPTGPTDRCALSMSGGTVTVGGAAVGTRPTAVYVDGTSEVHLRRSGVTKLIVTNTYANWTLPTVAYTADVISPALIQSQSTTVSDLCDEFLIQAQTSAEVTGGASKGYGGQLRLCGGSDAVGHADNEGGNLVLGLTSYTWAQCMSAVGAVVIAPVVVAPTAAPTTGAIEWATATGWHVIAPSASFCFGVNALETPKAMAFSGMKHLAVGDAQHTLLVLGRISTDATEVELTLTGGAPAAGTRFTVASGKTIGSSGKLVCRCVSGGLVGESAIWRVSSAAIANVGGTTALVGKPQCAVERAASVDCDAAVAPTHCTAGMAAARARFTADDPNDSWAVFGAGVDSGAENTFHWTFTPDNAECA